MNQTVIYYFTLKASTPLYFGGGKLEKPGDPNKLIRNSAGQPFVPGNSIGGALREHLSQIGVSKDIIRSYMGGIGENGKGEFVESKIFISDGKITGGNHVEAASLIVEKEGTAIDRAYGTAAHHHKYTFEYLPAGTELAFQVECDLEEQTVPEFEKWISSWARGLAEHHLLLGGKKSNGFGQFELKDLKRSVFSFDCTEALDEFIFERSMREPEPFAWEDVELEEREKGAVFTFSMTGSFPYGVYQAFDIKHSQELIIDLEKMPLTGLQQSRSGAYYLPSTSVKGVVRSEVEQLIRRMIGETSDGAAVERKCEELFGSTGRIGKLVFTDVELNNASPVQIKRYDNNEGKWVSGEPVYIKIDRLTGGAYNSALKRQQEIQGTAGIRFQLHTEREDASENPYMFPLVYVLRRIGAGIVPLGGRTVIGLGQFAAEQVAVEVGGIVSEVSTDEILSGESRAWLESCFESFKRWCSDADA